MGRMLCPCSQLVFVVLEHSRRAFGRLCYIGLCGSLCFGRTCGLHVAFCLQPRHSDECRCALRQWVQSLRNARSRLACSAVASSTCPPRSRYQWFWFAAGVVGLLVLRWVADGCYSCFVSSSANDCEPRSLACVAQRQICVSLVCVLLWPKNTEEMQSCHGSRGHP